MGYDIIAQSQSGTGKTATFTIGCLQRVDPSIKAPQMVVLAPTRELATQNHKVCTDLADYLVIEKNIPFRKSYKTIAEIVKFALSNKMKLSEISLKEFQNFEKSIDSNIYQYIDVKKSLARKKTNMSTNPKEVSKKIRKFQKFLK